MNTYYVANYGNDSNNGGPAYPWLTIQKALNTAIAGDIINIYGGSTYISGQLVFPHSGSPNNYITIQNYAGQTVNININDNNYIGITTNGQSYIQIIGLNVTAPNNFYAIDCYRGSNIMIKGGSYSNCKSDGVYAENSTYITIDGVSVYGCGTASSEEMISMVNVNHFEIKNCIVHDPGGTQRIGIDAKNASSNGDIHHNTVYNTGANGIYVDARGVASNIEVHDNLVFNCIFDAGIAMEDEGGTGSLTHIHIYDNIIYGCFRAFTMWQDGTATFNDCTFINNTCYNNTSSAAQEIITTSSPTYMTNCIIRNNIIFGLKSGKLAISDDNNALIIDHNLIYNSGGAWGSGNKLGTNYIVGNPLFVNSGTNDFHLQSNSPAINAGSSVGAPTIDFDGNPWTGCIGAYQYQVGGFIAGSSHVAAFKTTVVPAGIAYSVELWLGPDVNTKSATSGQIPMTSTGNPQNVNATIIMPTGGMYNVYIDIYYGTAVLASFVSTSVLTVSGTISEPVWT